MRVCNVIILHMSNYFFGLLFGKPPLQTVAVDSSFNHRPHFHESLLCETNAEQCRYSVSLGFLRHICSVWCNTESVMCSLLPESWQRLCSVCFHFTGGLPYSRSCVCFIWTHRWPRWPQIMLKEERETRINLHHGRGKHLLRSVKASANRGDPSRAFKMSHPSLIHLHNL